MANPSANVIVPDSLEVNSYSSLHCEHHLEYAVLHLGNFQTKYLQSGNAHCCTCGFELNVYGDELAGPMPKRGDQVT